jgi:hypothetical protein
MKTFKKAAAQGDVYFLRVGDPPIDGFSEQKTNQGNHIITHSETGHHHVMRADRVRRFIPDGDRGGMVSYIAVNEPTPITHLRPHDTHAPIMFSPGNYEIRRQREYTPQGWRRVED